MSLIGKRAPEWQATAYLNGDQKTVSNRDFEGKYYVLYWYPLDFTFVCPTEIQGFQRLLDEFDDEDCAVVGASTDSWFSHNQWFARNEETFPGGVTHPVLADTSHEVSRAFGVLKEDDGVAYRATVVVDDKGIVRAYSVNDLDVGRSPEEVLRTVQALKAGGLCGANWKKGDEFVG